MASKKEPWDAAVGNATWAARLAPAPGDLRIVQAFVNTAHPGTGADELESPQALAGWLARWRLLDPETELGTADLERAIAVREGLRARLQAHVGKDLDREAVARLDRAMTDAMLRVRFDGFAVDLEPVAGGIGGALGRLAQMVAQARMEGRLPRLKVCANDDCGLAFYDVSPNRTRRWCSMKLCGNQSKSRAFRRRNPGIRPLPAGYRDRRMK